MATDFDYALKCAMYTAGALDELRRPSLIVGGHFDATKKGMAWFDQIDASGFRPSESDIKTALAAYCHRDMSEVNDRLVLLVSRWKEAVRFAESKQS
jgi:hypothetical protein